MKVLAAKEYSALVEVEEVEGKGCCVGMCGSLGSRCCRVVSSVLNCYGPYAQATDYEGSLLNYACPCLVRGNQEGVFYEVFTPVVFQLLSLGGFSMLPLALCIKNSDDPSFVHVDFLLQIGVGIQAFVLAGALLRHCQINWTDPQGELHPGAKKARAHAVIFVGLICTAAAVAMLVAAKYACE